MMHQNEACQTTIDVELVTIHLIACANVEKGTESMRKMYNEMPPAGLIPLACI